MITRAARLSGLQLLICALATAQASCVIPHARAGRDADASNSAVRAEIDRLDAALLSIRSDLHAGRDVNQNDKWTLRLLGLAVMLLGLSYPVGKIVWLAATTLHHRSAVASRDDGPGRTTIDDRDIRDFIALKEKCAAVVTHAGSARRPPTGTSTPAATDD